MTEVKFHPYVKFVIAVDKPIPAIGGMKSTLQEDTPFVLVDKNNEKKSVTLRDLISLINQHNLCVTSQVFENCEDAEVPIYSLADEESTATQDTFSPVENAPWGFSESSIAWHKDEETGEATALVLAPGYRLHAVKEDKSGILVEDTNRDKIFVAWETFNPALLFETKQEFMQYNRQRKMVEEYRFRDWDYMLIATKEHNYNTEGQLIKVGWPDFEALFKRFQENGLDNETCLDEGNIKLSTPWVAYFKKPTKQGFTIIKAFLGAPGYTIESIVPRSENQKPGLNLVDENGEKVWVSWAGWHICFDYPNYAAFKEAKESGKIRYNRKRSYSNVGKGRYKHPSVNSDVKPLQGTALFDSRAAEDLPEDQVMASLVGVVPLS